MYGMYRLKVKAFLVAVVLAALTFGPAAGAPGAADAVKSKYQIRVDLTERLVFIDEWDAELREYVPTEHVFLCSPGKSSTPTPTGTFTARPMATDWQYDPKGIGEWVRFRYWPSCYVNSATVIRGSVIFHSVPSSRPDYGYVSQSDIDMMGAGYSHGCVRLWPRQAAWIRANCNGATIKIYYGAGYNSDLWYLRERLKQEIPQKDIWPDTVVTWQTKYVYTYYGDTLESLSELAGVEVDTLIELNPELTPGCDIPLGMAVKIK